MHGCGLTLTKESGETGLRRPTAPSEDAFLTSGAGWRWSRENTCTVPLSEDRASHCGLSPLLNAMLYMHAGSAPLRSSCVWKGTVQLDSFGGNKIEGCLIA